MGYQTAQVWADHSISVGEPDEDVTVTVLSGDTVFYGDRQVSSLQNYGSLQVGQSVVVSVPQDWLMSASSSLVSLSDVPQTSASASVATAALLKYAPPVQQNPTVVGVPAAGATYGSTGSPYADASTDLIFVLPSLMTGTLRWYGGRHVRIIGGVIQPTASVGNYCIVAQQVAGSIFLEGLEFPDQSAAQPDAIDVCGDWSGSSSNGFAPDVYIQNCRCMKIRATNATNHADFFQPQGVIGRLYVDKLTFASNYDGFTIATDSCNGVAPKGALFSRINSWWDAANASNPFTAHYWLNSSTGTTGTDTAPFPVTFDDVYADSTRGAASGGGRVQFADEAVYPNNGVTAAGGTMNPSGASPFAASEVIGASRGGTVAHGLGYAYYANPKLQIAGVVYNGSPDTVRTDVITEADGLGSFVPAGIGMNYRSPGYSQRPNAPIVVSTPAYAPQMPGLVVPAAFGGGYLGGTGGSAPGSLVPWLARVVIPKTGVLHDFAVYITTTSGNVLGAIFDTGDAVAGSRTRLWSSGSVACGTGAAWQKIGDPVLAVVQGQQLDFYFVADNATTAIARAAQTSAAMLQLPVSFLPATGGALPKLTGTTSAIGSLAAAPPTLAEASITNTLDVPLIIARVV